MFFSTNLLVIISAVFLSVYPFPADIIGYMPPWILIAGLFFMYRFPLKFGLLGMFFFGIINDLLWQVYLGTEAFLFLVIGLLFRRLMGYFSFSNELRKIVFTTLFIAVYELLRIPLYAWLYDQNIFFIQYQAILFSSILSIILLSTLHCFLNKE